jgi:hypothetical protein
VNNVGIPPPGRVRVEGGGAYFPRLGREKDLLGREGAGPRDPLPTEQISSQQALVPLRVVLFDKHTYIMYCRAKLHLVLVKNNWRNGIRYRCSCNYFM